MSTIATSGTHLARIPVTSRMEIGFLIFFALFQVALAIALMADRKGYGFGQWLLFGAVRPVPNPEYLTWSVEAETGDWGMRKSTGDED
jgi:hypothetical protein